MSNYKYSVKGEVVTVHTEESLNLQDKLPVGTYTVKYNDMSGIFYLVRIEDMPCPSRIYGNTNKQADKIFNTFNSRSINTGVLLEGEKGSGKTLLAKVLSKKAADNDLPTIVINTPFVGDNFNLFIRQLGEVVVFIDEFEKIYDQEKQEHLLTLLDGTYSLKKLFILTCNNRYKIDKNMINRPGRLYYSTNYEGIDSDFVQEYCQENLKEIKFMEKVCALPSVIIPFNFDTLQAIVEECNRYPEDSFEDIIDLLNIESSQQNIYQVVAFVDGKQLKGGSTTNTYENPIFSDRINIYGDLDGYEKNDEFSIDEYITNENSTKVDLVNGIFQYKINTSKGEMFVTFSKKMANKKFFEYLS